MEWLEKLKVGGDFIVSEYDAAYCREKVEIDVAGLSLEANVLLPAGTPFNGNNVEGAAGISGCDGLLIQPVTLMPGMATIKCAVLRRGPAVINIDALPDEDIAGSTINKTTWRTAIEALGIVCRTEPEVQEEQTT